MAADSDLLNGTMEPGAKKSRIPTWLRTAAIGRNPKRTLVRAAILVAIVFLVRAYVLLPVRISGPSMMPTFAESGVNFVNRLAYIRSEPRRGDIVVIRFSGEHVSMLKRIIGLPGETVEFRQGRAVINGVPLDEPYVKISGDWNLAPRVVGPDEYFVIGDNRSISVFGIAERKRILGKILLCKNLFASSLSSR